MAVTLIAVLGQDWLTCFRKIRFAWGKLVLSVSAPAGAERGQVVAVANTTPSHLLNPAVLNSVGIHKALLSLLLAASFQIGLLYVNQAWPNISTAAWHCSKIM